MLNATERFERRRRRVRFALKVNGNARPRLSVHRSGRHIYCQVIDDVAGHTVAAASTIDTAVKGELKSGADREAARRVGMLVAERAKAVGIETVKFDRGGYRFHGRVKALADGAREGGLQF